MQMQNKGNKIKENRMMCALEYLLLFFMVICITSIWLRQAPIFYYLGYLKASIPILTVGIVLAKALSSSNKIIISKECFSWIMFFVLCVFGGAIGSSGTASFSRAIEITVYCICFLLLSYALDKEELSRFFMRYVNIITLIAVISLFFYFGGSILNIIPATGKVSFEWDLTRSADSYFFLYYEPQISDNLLLGVTKNCGIFTEATMYGFLLSNAYMFHRMNMKSGKHGKIISIILLGTILTTLSTTPILTVLIFETSNILTARISNRHMANLRTVFFPVIVLAAIWIATIVIGDKLSTASYDIRFDHIVSCIKVFRENLLLGLGYGALDVLKTYFSYQQGLSVGIPYLLAMGGIGALLMLSIPVIRFLINSWTVRNWMGISYVLAFIFSFFFTNIVFNFTLQWLIISGVFLKGSYEMKKEVIVKRGGYCHEIISSIIDNLRTKVPRPDIGMAM